MHWKHWDNAGIVRVRDLLDENGCFLSHVSLAHKYGIKCNFLDLLTLRQCIPYEWRNELSRASKKSPLLSAISVIVNNTKKDVTKVKCKDFYWELVDNIHIQPTCKSKWMEVFPKLKDFDNRNWAKLFRIPFAASRETRLQTFQYKIIHRVTPCNKFLFNLNIKDNGNCTYCEEKPVDDLLHFFIHCNKVKLFWKSFIQWWNSLCDIKIDTICEQIEEIIIFGMPSSNPTILVLNLCLIIAKFHIYKQRLFHDNCISFYMFLSELKNKLFIEESICIRESSPAKFKKYQFIYDNL